jgi:hypothetical protein
VARRKDDAQLRRSVRPLRALYETVGGGIRAEALFSIAAFNFDCEFQICAVRTRIINDAWASIWRKLVSLGYCSSLWFRKVTHDVKLTNLQNLPPRPENRFNGQTRRLSS